MDFKNEVVDLVSSQVDLPKEKITALIERPKNAKMVTMLFQHLFWLRLCTKILQLLQKILQKT